ncbi:DUF1761 domain-containing protein [Actinomycetospora sp. OC33-EN08]|uniref:DUF1761 domain-containing protein n=1 Tax=Actinomycetospora aurantiaca TaxID=3129233 RepID=A0ABU8MVX7_9PSEU
MFAAFAQINWLAVVIATVASAVLGGLYFGAVVGKQYLRVLGREGQEAPKPSPVAAVGPLVCGFLVVLASAVLVAALGLTTVGDALVFGLVVGIGYLLAMTFQIAINPNFPHPLRYGALNAPYFLVTSLVTSVLLVLV